MPYYVYIAECTKHNGDIELYVGFTSRTPNERLKDHVRNIKLNHNNRYVCGKRFTKAKWIYYEQFVERIDALKREREIKKKGTAYKRSLINGFAVTKKST